MLITDDFVMLNFPKTGSSFARRILKQLYYQRRSNYRKILEKLRLCNPSIIELILPRIDGKISCNGKDQHSTSRQIPIAHINKPILTIIRNPLSLYLSMYHFRLWQRYPPMDRGLVLEQYPQFPNLTYSDFLEMMQIYGTKNFLGDITPKINLGYHTIRFIQFYFKDPESVLNKIDDDYIEKEIFWEDMASNITFVHQENLNTELQEFLLSIGIPPHELNFINSVEKVNVSKKSTAGNYQEKSLLDSSITNQIIERDKLLFKIFPEYLPTI